MAEEPAATETEKAAAAAHSDTIEEITVTARKREELAQNAPVSLTALTAANLNEANVNRLDGLHELSPNTQVLIGRTGVEPQVYIRGVGQLDTLITSDPGVAIYADGVYMSRAAGSLLSLLDAERVEVLRGPQGTLFGKNTVGGAINVITAKPQDQLAGSFTIRPGNYDSVDTHAVLNAPIPLVGNQKLLTRFSLLTQNSEGYTENHVYDNNAGNRENLAFLGSLRYAPVDNVEINWSGTWGRDHSRGRGGQCVFVQDPTNPALAGILPATFKTECKASRPFDYRADTGSLSDVPSYGTWGTVDWHIGEVGMLDDLNVKFIGSWRQQEPRLRDDIDMTDVKVARYTDGDLVPLGYEASTGGGALQGEPGFARQTSQELQVNTAAFDEDLQAVTGLYGLEEKAEDHQVVSVLQNLGSIGQNTGAPTTDSRSKVDNWTFGIYGQGTYSPGFLSGGNLDWVKNFSATLGLRWTLEHKDFSKFSTNPLYDFALDPSGRFATPYDGNQDKTFDQVTPAGSLSYTFDDYLDGATLSHLMPYFTCSRGFKSGGFNAGGRFSSTPGQLDGYKPETVTSCEVGAKTVAFNERLGLNLAYFDSSYDDIQVIATRTDPRNPFAIDRVVENAAKATIRGFEVEATAHPIPGLRIDGNLGYLYTNYDEFKNGIDDVTGLDRDRSGETFNNVPKLQFTLATQYSIPIDASLPWASGWITPRLQYHYQSSIHYFGPELDALTQDSVSLLSARLSYEFYDDRAVIALWGSNLLDETYFNQGLTLVQTFGHAIRYYAPPRMFGAELTYRL